MRLRPLARLLTLPFFIAALVSPTAAAAPNLDTRFGIADFQLALVVN
ncbi:MAG TPA: hypothetical protein VGE94_04400 [Chloroflexota bacterium]